MNLTIRGIFRCILEQLATFSVFVPSPSYFVESTVPLLRKLICNFIVGLSAQSNTKLTNSEIKGRCINPKTRMDRVDFIVFEHLVRDVTLPI